MSVNRLLIYDGTTTIDSESEYGIVTLEVDGQDEREVQNISSQTWYDEDGEDAFIPNKVTFKAYDVSVMLGVKDSSTETAREIKHNFLDAIVGKELAVEQEYVNSTMCGCYVSKVEDDEIGDDFLTFKVTFRVTKPSKKFVIPTYDPVYSTPVVRCHYPLSQIDAKGGTYYVRDKSFTQTKTTTYKDGSTEVETITSGGTWKFEIILQSPTTAGVTINENTGAITFPKNTSTSQVNVSVRASVTANGVTGSTSSYSIVFVQAYNTHSTFYIGQLSGTASAFAAYTAQNLINGATGSTSESNATTVTAWIYYILLPSDVSFVSLSYTSNGITSVLGISDFNCSHADIEYNGTTYKVLALRTQPNSIVYNLTVSW